MVPAAEEFFFGSTKGRKMYKKIFTACTFVLGIFLGTQTVAVATAKTFEVDNIALYGDPVTATVGGRSVYVGPQVMTGPNGTLDFFCVDPLGTNYLGGQNPPMMLKYASTWSGLTNTQAGQVQYLVNLSKGASWQMDDAIDVAIIWRLGVAVTDISNPWVATEAASLLAHPGFSTPAGFWIPTNSPYVGNAQVGMSGSVPEPGTWAMMLIGFASLAYLGHRRQKRMIVA